MATAGTANSKAQIPDGWRQVRRGDTLELDQPGSWGEEPTINDPGVPVLRAANLTRDGRIDPTRIARRRLSRADLDRRLMRHGDLSASSWSMRATAWSRRCSASRSWARASSRPCSAGRKFRQVLAGPGGITGKRQLSRRGNPAHSANHRAT